MTDQAKVILSLLQLSGIGRKTVYKYMLPTSSSFFTIECISKLISEAQKKTSRVKDFTTDEISGAMETVDKIIDDCERCNIKISSIFDSDFPERLKKIDDPPVILFYRGNIEQLNEQKTIAIIGTREPTDYGFRIAVRIGEMMADSSITTVSGLALGCDTGGHTGTINRNGTTIAILANGLDEIYPKENQGLASEIIDLGGCIISEYPPHAEIQRGFFVDRDRLQAALSDAVFVVETDVKGGTMHTVGFAKKYGKRVYCFNHPDKYLSEPKTHGNQKLISEGAALPVFSKEQLADMHQEIRIHIRVFHGVVELVTGHFHNFRIPRVFPEKKTAFFVRRMPAALSYGSVMAGCRYGWTACVPHSAAPVSSMAVKQTVHSFSVSLKAGFMTPR